MKKKFFVIPLIILIIISFAYFYQKVKYLSSISYNSIDTLIPKEVKEDFIFDDNQGFKSTRIFQITKKEKETLFKKLSDIDYICSELACDYKLSSGSYTISLIKKFLAFNILYNGEIKINKNKEQVSFLIDGKISIPSLSNNFREPVNLTGKITFDYISRGFSREVVRKAHLISPYFSKIKSHPFRTGFQYAALTLEKKIFKKLLVNF
tara:strand:- start:335 stop:958 length:624 start_codon:yes stop_codon:yes gene_type:complete